MKKTGKGFVTQSLPPKQRKGKGQKPGMKKVK